MPLDKLDIGILLVSVVLIVAFVAWVITMTNRGLFPSVSTLQDLATVFSTKGGIILVLLIMWWLTLSGTVAFGVWVIAKGIDPQHAVVVTLLGMLVSQAFGNVNGSLFTMFKGEDPRPLGTKTATSTTSSSSTTNTLTASGGE
jgi:hypothetical protein